MLNAYSATEPQFLGVIQRVAQERYGQAFQKVMVEINHMGAYRIIVLYGYGAGTRFVEGYLDEASLARYRHDEIDEIIEEWTRGLVNV